jgi:hypothetical protein
MTMASSCSFNEGNLRAPKTPRDASGETSTLDAGGMDGGGTGQRDLGGDADPGKTSDLLASGDANRLGDGPPARDGLGSAGEDARETEPDSAGALDTPAGGGPDDSGMDRDDVPVVQPNDASLAIDGSGTDTGPFQTVDAPADVPSSRDGVMTDGTDMGGADYDARDQETAEAGELERDAQMDAPDVGPVAVDGAVPDSAPAIDPDLVLWYQFDESSGTIAYDSAQFGGVARNATLMTTGPGGSATFSTVSQVGTHALDLSPTSPGSSGGGYVVLPTIDTLAPGAITIAVWVKMAVAGSAQNWERIYDFGNSTTDPTWFNLAARNGESPYGPIFNISNTGHATSDQQRLTGSTALTANTWNHIAVVLPAGATYTGVMYVNGEVAATNNAMTVHLSDIGATTNNWFGRSQFTDPYFSGSLDDFRVYRRALSQQEVAALMALR